MTPLPDAPPIDYELIERDLPPDQLDFMAPWPPDDLNYVPDFAPFEPQSWDDFAPDYLPPAQTPLPGLTTQPNPSSWSWTDARLVGVERVEADLTRYEIGVVDLYADTATGDPGGRYLPVASFGDLDVAAAFYHDLQQQTFDQSLAAHDLPDFAEMQAANLSGAVAWRDVGEVEYQAYLGLEERVPSVGIERDLPPEAALDPLLQEAIALGGVVTPWNREMAPDPAAFQALNAIGLEAEGFSPAADPPPFYDADTGTAYWIGVFQPDPADRESCLTSILSLGRNEAGELEAQLAPCVPGDWDKAYANAEYLIGVAQKGGIDRCFDAAEGMALATDQREWWAAERGLPLEPDASQAIADYAASGWEVDL